jgi:hypothetical protein
MKIAVIDGQGAGIGQTIIKRLRRELSSKPYIFALGTNNIATSQMVKAGANLGITGESNISCFLETERLDFLIGPIGILCCEGINGEITASVSKAIFHIDCTKYIIPLKKHGFFIPGTRDMEIKEIITEIITDIKTKDLE